MIHGFIDTRRKTLIFLSLDRQVSPATAPPRPPVILHDSRTALLHIHKATLYLKVNFLYRITILVYYAENLDHSE